MKTNILKYKEQIIHFKIPVTNIDRAKQFYKSVFDFMFEDKTTDENKIAIFPFSEKQKEIFGALYKNEIQQSEKNEVIIYFVTPDIESTLRIAIKNGALLVKDKISIGEFASIAKFKDPEGNLIALYEEPEAVTPHKKQINHEFIPDWLIVFIE